MRVRWRGQEGTIIDINGGLYMVSLDDGRTVDSFPESDLHISRAFKEMVEHGIIEPVSGHGKGKHRFRQQG